jgi:hypothetical protein
LPADWTPSEAGIELARALGLTPAAVLEKFRDFWISKAGANGRKLDWDAVWRNWCREDAARSKRMNGKRAPPAADAWAWLDKPANGHDTDPSILDLHNVNGTFNLG